MVRSVAVIGGGISGLAAAWELCRIDGDVTVTVLEGSDRLGGKLRLEDVGGVRIDVGAESVLARRPEALALFDELGVDDLVTHPGPAGASIVSRGRRWAMPRGTLMGVPSDPSSVRGLLTDEEVDRLAHEIVTGPVTGDLSVGDLVDARLGAAVTDRLVEPLLAGVYAGHSREISAELAVPALAAAAHDGRPLLDVARAAAVAAASGPQAGRPVFATLTGGLGTLPEVLERRLLAAGVQIRTSAMARTLRRDGAGWVVSTGPTTAVVDERFDAVVLAAPAAPASRLLRDVAPAAAAALGALEYASMAIVTLALDGPAPAVLDGSGFLVPPTEALTIKASTFSTVKWPWLAAAHADRTFLRASVGRHREEAGLQRPDDDLVDVALADLRTVLGPGLPDPVATHVQRWGGGLPQYAVGHRARLAPTRLLPEGLALCGAAYDGVGIPACIASGRSAARAVVTPG
ncbi:protoporphyrinogen oxidase [Terrabacter aerolatus]|uniref:Coproporphyrinogen III oxidase n=1 Tax=Terrabacter aerolatus TaxID=422442 RepID=A0A512CYC2_9MICO|nr:protoporphyrinogen oxidase [Terrabacter aerolatus]GEO29233.1 protoporphyrinogen oxidase [Terrabacter aerolatus]